jgi:segregation and condensation protein A
MTLQEDYRVSLEAFQGPLDLLLFLIRRAEVDVTEIAVAEITDQYLAFLSRVDDVDVEVAGEFLVMAATLIELKSRSLAPPEAAETGETSATGGDDGDAARETGDPGAELVAQLLAYQRFRIAAEELDVRRVEFAHRFAIKPRLRDAPVADEDAPEPVEIELEDVHVMDLADAYERIMTSIDFDRLGDHVVEIDDTPIALYQADLLDRLDRADDHRLTLQQTFGGQTPVQRVGFFLATLELARLRRLRIVQDDLDGPIELVLTAGAETETAPETAAETRA